MPLPPKLEEKILRRFDELIEKGGELHNFIKRDSAEFNRRQAGSMIVAVGEFHNQQTSCGEYITNCVSLLRLVVGDLERRKRLIKKFEYDSCNSYSISSIVGILRGLKSDYEAGFMDELGELIEANVASDYMGQAEQLMDEGVTGQHEHVPAAVLAGAVLEDALRRLCRRKGIPLEITKSNGKTRKKTLADYIADLKKVKVFNNAKADLLMSLVRIRNHAAHGEFTEFKKADVEDMIKQVKRFLADYM